jgi:tRNA threonylcarbamoyladenosine biosynthesis protein TsaE
MNHTFFTDSPYDTQIVGQQIGEILQKGDVLCLTGDLGAGKTTLIKGIAQKLTNTPPEEITSPTFTYLHIYQGPVTLYHFDLYRLSSEEEFLQAGFHEFLQRDGICCIEWPDRLPKNLSSSCALLDIAYLGPEKRKISLWRPNVL